MSGERIIDRANLNGIESNIRNLRAEIGVVAQQIRATDHNVQVVHQGVVGAQQRLDQLTNEFVAVQQGLDDLTHEFRDFVRKDILFKELQLAETRLVKIRQEIETNFGHYNEVRRRVTGILQAVDVRLVKKETIENTTEEHMLAAPRYWLAPCLIALAAWLNDNKELAERAMMEAISRNDEKTALFFALVTRRGSRYKASRQWLDRYFGLQDPQNLEREIIVLIDGFTNGIFGPEARSQVGKRVEDWIEELSQRQGFIEEQTKQWRAILNAKQRKLDDGAYSFLRKHSSTWPQLEASMMGAKLHTILSDYFKDILNQPILPHASIAIAVDALLDTLVSKFDDEELPLRRDERLQQLIVEESGDRNAAQNRFNLEKVLEKKVSFTQLLTNFATNPEVSQASAATQKYAVALSKDWIRQAHDDMTLDNRMNVPEKIQIEIDDWSGSTVNGDNESELLEQLTKHVEARRDADLKKLRHKIMHWAGLAVGILMLIAAIAAPPLLFLGGGGIAYFFFKTYRLRKARAKVTEEYKQFLQQCQDMLRAVLSDVVDWRNDYGVEDGHSVLVTQLLESVTPEHYTFSSYDSARNVLKS
ncbi:MAG: hypothetical protein K0R57_4309 [Paenibacillaceae bacterium]|jgi:hypothetical protein|nr:hypothetical protein [Paenibacillaceae bacterium]